MGVRLLNFGPNFTQLIAVQTGPYITLACQQEENHEKYEGKEGNYESMRESMNSIHSLAYTFY